MRRAFVELRGARYAVIIVEGVVTRFAIPCQPVMDVPGREFVGAVREVEGELISLISGAEARDIWSALFASGLLPPANRSAT